MARYNLNKKLKRHYMKEFAKDFPKHTLKNVVVGFLYTIAGIGLFILPVMYMITSPVVDLEQTFYLFLASIILFMIPFGIGKLVNQQFFENALWNMIDEERESIEVTSDNISYVWHHKGESPERMYEYNIHHDYIERVIYEKATRSVTIVGSANIIPYENYALKIEDNKIKARSTPYDYVKTIFLAFNSDVEFQETLSAIKEIAEDFRFKER